MRHPRLMLLVVLESVAVAGLMAVALSGPEGENPGSSGVAGAVESGAPGPDRRIGGPESRSESPDPSSPPIAAVDFAETVVEGASDAVGIVLFGRIRGRGGNDPGPGWVEIRDPFGRRAGSSTDRGSGYAIAGLQPGRWRVLAHASGYRDLDESLDLATTPNPHRLDLELDPAPCIKIRLVTPAGAPFSRRALGEDFEYFDVFDEMSVAATTELPKDGHLPRAPAPGRPFGAGRFRRAAEVKNAALGLGPEHFGVLELLSDDPVFVSLAFRTVVLGTASGGPGVSELSFTLGPDMIRRSQGAIRIRAIAAESGKPLDPFSLRLGSRSFGTARLPRDEQGFLQLGPVIAGTHRLFVGAGGRESVALRVDVPAGGVADAGVVTLRAAATIRGCVQDAGGRPAVAHVVAVPLDAGIDGRRTAGSGAATDAHGSFVIQSLPPGRHALTAAAPGRCSPAVVVLADAAGSEAVTLVLDDAAEVFLECVGAVGAEAELLIRDAEGLARWSHDTSSFDRTSLYLPRGAYVLDVLKDGRTERSIPFQVASGPVRVEVRR